MRIRRCTCFFLEPYTYRSLDLAGLLAGSAKLEERSGWRALAAHIDGPIEVDAAQVLALGSIPPDSWSDFEALAQTHSRGVIEALLSARLLMIEGESETLEADGIREWNGLNAVAWRHSRWRQVDAERATAWLGRDAADVRDRLGTPPALVGERGDASLRLSLPRSVSPGPCSGLPDARATCRNFDPARPIDLSVLSQMMENVFAARAVSRTSDVAVMKRAVPSAGGLHPIEAYLLIQHVEAMEPGLYHYHPVEHSLQPLRTLGPEQAREYAAQFVARQDWFADAAVLVVLAARFARNHWKYRRHTKSFRAMVLDAGHLSQMQYLAATELGLGAFITAAINEGDIEDAFGLDPMEEGVLAVTGFGWRGERMEVLEFDPLRKVWPDWSPE